MVSDEAAEAIRELYGPLRRFAAVVGRSDVDPDDLLHDAWARTMATRRIEDLDNPGAYLRKTIMNLAASSRRRRARYQQALVRLGPAEDAAPSYPSDVAELLRLGSRERAVLFLRDIEGLDYEDVAEIVGRPAPSCRVIASRARRKLSALMDEEVAR